MGSGFDLTIPSRNQQVEVELAARGFSTADSTDSLNVDVTTPLHGARSDEGAKHPAQTRPTELTTRQGGSRPIEETDAKKDETKEKAPRLEALDGIRWGASMMIVCFHFYHLEGKGPIDLGRFAKFGSSWTQFFFILSGFVLGYVEMARPAKKKKAPMSTYQYVRRRLETMYPTYLMMLTINVFKREHVTSFQWCILPLHVFLLQAWFPVVIKE